MEKKQSTVYNLAEYIKMSNKGEKVKNQYETKRLSLVRSELGMALEVCNYYLRNKNYFEEYDSDYPEDFLRLNIIKNP